MPGYGPARGGRIPTWVKPPKEAQRIARRALKDRAKLPKSKRGGLDAAEAKEQGITSGVLRAESIAKGDWQPAEDVNAFFQRFKGTHAAAQDKPWDDSKVQQAWDLWGGDAMWQAAKKALRRENPERHYLRFGGWPKSERSRIWLPRVSGSARATHELGVSVYSVDLDAQGKWAVSGDFYSSQFVGTLDDFISQLADGKVEAYLVRGDLVGEGADGEPLLRNLVTVKRLRCEDIYDCAHYLLRTTGRRSNPSPTHTLVKRLKF